MQCGRPGRPVYCTISKSTTQPLTQRPTRAQSVSDDRGISLVNLKNCRVSSQVPLLLRPYATQRWRFGMAAPLHREGQPAGFNAGRSTGGVAMNWKTTAGVVLTTALFLTTLPHDAYALPSYARQTGLTCQACHTVFPELTPFGRLFKLNGYQIDNIQQVQTITTSKDFALLLNQIPPLSLMLQASHTQTRTALPDSAIAGAAAQNGQVLFPQQASLFYAGRIAPNLGSFIQITYDSASGNVHWDNTEIRYAKQVGGVYGLTYGATVNNNPTVQDVWNSTPAWQVPFDQRTSAAPVPGAATLIDGVLAGKGVVGLTGYVWIKNSIYGEVGAYRSAPQGFNVNGLAGPLDSTAGGVVTGGAPYWRVAVDHQWHKNSLSAGAYGMNASLSGANQ